MNQNVNKGSSGEHALKIQLREIGMRLKFYLEHRGLNIESLHRQSGITKKQIHKIIDGKKYPVKIILPLLETLRDMNGRWLIYGEGEMLKKNARLQENMKARTFGPINKEPSKIDTADDKSVNGMLKKLLAEQKLLLKQNKKILLILDTRCKFLKAKRPK